MAHPLSTGPRAALLERDEPLARLTLAVQALSAQQHGGACVVLGGESGAGKSSLLKATAAAAAARSAQLDWLSGLCEPLLSPAPWGPLLDMLDQLPPSLAAMVQSGRPSGEVMVEWLAWLKRRQRPMVLVIDDAQWADGATLDLLRYLGRRVEGLPLLMVISHRDDELPPDHPLHGVLGGLPPAVTRRIRLAPLSPQAVRQAASQAGRPAQGLYELTQGNPFLLTQLLESPAEALPVSVREAVIARMHGLSSRARDWLEQISVSPVPLEHQALEVLGIEVTKVLDECGPSGLLVNHDEAIGFRHELARRAVESRIDSHRRRTLHRRLLEALPKARASRRVHHAEGAGLSSEVLHLAQVAADEAAGASAHRQAEGLYALAWKHAGDKLSPAQRSAMLERWSLQCELIGALDPARARQHDAIAGYRQAGMHREEGVALVRMARLQFLLGDLPAGKRIAREAIQLLESLGRPRGLAMAYAVMAQLHLLDATPAAARDWGRRAMALAEADDDLETLVHARNTVGSAELTGADQPEAWALLKASLAGALANGWAEPAARAYVNLLVHQLVHRRHAEWPPLADEALAYCTERDFDLYIVRLHIRRAFGLIELGQWDRADADLRDLLQHSSGLLAMDRQQAEHLRAQLALRRGDASVRRYWVELLEGRRRLQPAPWYAPVAVAVTEAAWLLGRPDAMVEWACEALPEAVASGEHWRSGQLAVWLRRMGKLEALPEIPLAPPCEAELRGDLEAASVAWVVAGNPWEQALALLGGDVGQLRRALAIFERLGAAPAAAMARRRLRDHGEVSGLRGQNRATRSDPLGLTPRERRLLGELASGLSYREIAARWHRSPRTVENHAAALLAKLGLSSRREIAIERQGPDGQVAPLG
jgi:DNA-binding CsgD family transcriptional regulator/energy-coupling factor transporter ATP-binding protein EcfA2